MGIDSPWWMGRLKTRFDPNRRMQHTRVFFSYKSLDSSCSPFRHVRASLTVRRARVIARGGAEEHLINYMKILPVQIYPRYKYDIQVHPIMCSFFQLLRGIIPYEYVVSSERRFWFFPLPRCRSWRLKSWNEMWSTHQGGSHRTRRLLEPSNAWENGKLRKIKLLLVCHAIQVVVVQVNKVTTFDGLLPVIFYKRP